MKKQLIGILLAGFSISVIAGSAIEAPVEINLETNSASGNMKTARFSKNDSEQIGCGTRTIGATDYSPAFSWGFCQAQVIEGESVMCFAYDNPELVDQIKSLASFSYISFRWDDEGNCTYAGSSTQSQYIPSKGFKQ